MGGMDSIAKNLEAVRRRIEQAAARAGRKAEDIRLMAVTKTKSSEVVEEAYRAGLRLFGENRVQEAVEKFSNFYDDAELHIIGHLQSNKAKKAVDVARCVQSIDKLKTAWELEKRCAAAEKQMDIYLEYNTSGEESKSGYRDRDLFFRDIEKIAELPHLRIRGLMTIGPLTDNETEVRSAFAYLRELFEETRRRYTELDLRELSMGMTGDFEWAVLEGSTMVRVGTALFGAR
ncbi:MAG TPA: YggS family pyridoxal phosphate-dependent enzyme [Sediminispirochaeta sp.]|nr:YggS family pyridoxal phosphate-dependent enzyme [Sediminispirochaeta sp.]